MKLNWRQINWRRLSQIFFLALIAFISVNHTLAESGNGIAFLSDASLHAICPFGGVVTLYQLVTVGTFIQKIHSSSVILMGIVLLISLLLGPVFCGWICPFGTVQEWVGKLGKKFFKKKYNRLIPSGIDRSLRYFRFVVLGWVVFMTARSGTIVFSNIDPYYALFNFWTSEVAVAGLVMLGAVLILSLFVERPWCKYACPYGALLGLFNKVSLFKIRRKASSCVQCGKCSAVCPMNIDVATAETVDSTQCIRCYECTSEKSCPVDDTITIEFGNK